MKKTAHWMRSIAWAATLAQAVSAITFFQIAILPIKSMELCVASASLAIVALITYALGKRNATWLVLAACLGFVIAWLYWSIDFEEVRRDIHEAILTFSIRPLNFAGEGQEILDRMKLELQLAAYFPAIRNIIGTVGVATIPLCAKLLFPVFDTKDTKELPWTEQKS